MRATVVRVVTLINFEMSVTLEIGMLVASLPLAVEKFQRRVTECCESARLMNGYSTQTYYIELPN
jgi:hypothetical protein